mgnify:FL=1|jgi:cobalamin biosynthesis Mg chelatase CobN|tara:strand:- start:2930 stop:3604 length:675 start_codon:yes stop_codon:yes gene_type:complete
MYEYTDGARIDTLGRPRARATPRRLRRASSSLDMRAATTLNAPAITLRVARARRPATTPRSSSTNARARANVSTERASSVRANSRAEDAENDASSSMSGELDAADEFAFEPRSKSKRKRDASTTRRAKVDVSSRAVDSYLGKTEKTLSQESEEAYVTFLFYYICAIFVIGIVLGLDSFGKFPESADAFVSEKLYPFFTPFTGGFLVFSSVYGLIKTRDDPTAGK